jgi:hypothetical protein
MWYPLKEEVSMVNYSAQALLGLGDNPPPPWGGYASAPEANPEKYKIWIFGDGSYPMHRWREAVLKYLFRGWKLGQVDGELAFGNIRLIRDGALDMYRVYGKSESSPPNGYVGSYSLRVDATRNEVEVGLVRFVKDWHLGRLEIRFATETLILSKRERPSEYDVCVFDHSAPLFP